MRHLFRNLEHPHFALLVLHNSFVFYFERIFLFFILNAHTYHNQLVGLEEMLAKISDPQQVIRKPYIMLI